MDNLINIPGKSEMDTMAILVVIVLIIGIVIRLALEITNDHRTNNKSK